MCAALSCFPLFVYIELCLILHNSVTWVSWVVLDGSSVTAKENLHLCPALMYSVDTLCVHNLRLHPLVMSQVDSKSQCFHRFRGVVIWTEIDSVAITHTLMCHMISHFQLMTNIFVVETPTPVLT